jgi:hypothetical protein
MVAPQELHCDFIAGGDGHAALAASHSELPGVNGT